LTDVLLDTAAAPGVALITFSGEAKLNAFDLGTWEDLERALGKIAADPAVDVGVLTGTGRAFVAGADIDVYVDATPEEFAGFQRLVRRVTDRLAAGEEPVIAAVNGYALGGGFEIVLACDLVVASATARFGLPEAKLGLLPGGGGTQRLPRAAGPRAAKEILMTGRLFDAQEALRLGVVNRVVQPEDLLEACFALAAEIREVAPLAVRMAKRLVDAGPDLPLAEALDLEGREQPLLFETRDAKEGITAFKRKRAPRFVGE
jgi:enoyl-CoA hydratase